MGGTDLNEAKLKDDLNQLPLPWRKKVHTFDPEFFKCDQKIVKYNSSQLADWRVCSDSIVCKRFKLISRHLRFKIRPLSASLTRFFLIPQHGDTSPF